MLLPFHFFKNPGIMVQSHHLSSEALHTPPPLHAEVTSLGLVHVCPSSFLLLVDRRWLVKQPVTMSNETEDFLGKWVREGRQFNVEPGNHWYCFRGKSVLAGPSTQGG